MESRRLLTALLAAAVVSSLAATAVAAPPPQAPARGHEEFQMEVLSSRAEYVSGGDARISISVPHRVPLRQVHVSMNGEDVTNAFQETAPGSKVLEGVVTGLRIGDNTVEVRPNGNGRGQPSASMTLTNYPISGPMFSGPHQEPFICETGAAGLGPAVDDDCFAETKVEFLYMTTGGSFVPLPSGDLPDDVAQTTTTLGETVDFIVRRETGVINRAVYQTAVLYDPSATDTDSAEATSGWNGRLIYSYGGGCNAGYHQGQGNGGIQPQQLGLGFAVASSSLNVLDNNCNHVSSAETTSMVKEHFIETYGDVLHTIGWGASGGAISQHMIGQAYPGLLDGIIPTASYPDASSIMPGIGDCRLVHNFLTSGGGATLDAADLAAIVGHFHYEDCQAWTFSFSNRLVADEGCPGALPVELRYHPVDNPEGARCTVTDHVINLLGTNPDTGVAYTLYDNHGVQYGLDALNSGQITVDEFLELNAGIGGLDVDGHFAAERSDISPVGIQRSYQTGLVQAGAGGLSTMPIIDLRPYLDTITDIHVRFHSFSTRERLVEANGDADNHVIQVTGDFATFAAATGQALLLMDQWLTNIESDTDIRTHQEVVAAKPAALVDGCWDAAGDFIAETATYDGPGECNTLYPSHGDPRTAAGGPVSSDVLKCQTVAPEASDYSVAFTTEQWAQVTSIFPDGVCDWDQTGVGQVGFFEVWQSYGP